MKLLAVGVASESVGVFCDGGEGFCTSFRCSAVAVLLFISELPRISIKPNKFLAALACFLEEP